MPQTDANGSTQHDFLTALSRDCPAGLHFLVTLKEDGRFGTWAWDGHGLRPGAWYFYTGASDIKRSRRAENTKAVRAIVIDDVGTKVDAARINAVPTWRLETSPGNEQWGYLLEQWESDIPKADALAAGLVAAGLQDPGVPNACRLFRIPDSVNDKPGMDGWTAKLRHVDWDSVYTLDSLAKALDVKPGKPKPVREKPEIPPAAGQPDPIYDWLLERGHVVTPMNSSGWSEITCPFASEHSGDEREESKYLHLGHSDVGRPNVYCFHSHGRGEKESVYRERFFRWVVEQGGPQRPPPYKVVSAKFKDMLRTMSQRAAPPPATMPSIVHNVRERTDLYNFVTLRQALGLLDTSKLPNVALTAKGQPRYSQPTSFENVHAGLEQLGVQPRLNLMNAETSFILPERLNRERFGLKTESEIADMIHGSLSDIFGRASMHDKRELKDCIVRVGNTDFWHPMRDWILSRPWDGVDRFEPLAATLPTPTPELFRMYFRRWLLQTIEATCGWTVRRKSQKGLVLVLVGKQRIGKSRWLMSLAPEFGRMGKHLNLNGGSASRDSIHQSLLGAITELGELDATFKRAEISLLKAFITEETDLYRLPFAPVWLDRPRCTSFCGSVNEQRFLNDPTGSGRFMPVPVEGRPQIDHGLDMQQLWAQVYTWWLTGEPWWLQQGEEDMRDGGASDFEVVDPVPEIIEESLDRRRDTTRYPVQVIIGARHMLELCELDALHPKALASSGTTLTRLLGKGRNLAYRGSPTGKANRWIINATMPEVEALKLYLAKPVTP